jgi:signal transduction histidine kinase
LEALTNLLYLIKGQVQDQSTQKFVELAEQELNRASEVVRHSLKFHRQATKPGKEKIADLLNSTLAVYEARFRQGQILIHRKFANSVAVDCLGGELRQVFANLLSNALDAMPLGGTLRLAVSDSRNWLTGEPGVRLAVADTGSGISKTTLQHIFEPFFTTKGIQGSGLGLWLSAEILNRHRAKLKIRSRQEVGRSGTVFYIFFPIEGVSTEGRR